jgi:hypothetical protein
LVSLLTLCVVKRLPYADHIIALSKDGSIAEQGTFSALASTGGFVSSFNLPSPDWNYQPEEFTYKIAQHPTPAQTAEHIEEEASKSTGDISIYLYYIKSIGWTSILTFAACISAFIFCISFPSELVSILCCSNGYGWLMVARYLVKMVGCIKHARAVRETWLLSWNLCHAWGSRASIPHRQLLVSPLPNLSVLKV